MVRFKALVLVGCALASAIAVACGGSSGGSSGAAKPGSPAAGEAPTSAAVQTINVKDVENGDVYAFDPNQIQLRVGQVVIHYTNPAGSARAHTFELRTLDGSADIFKSDQIQPGNGVDFQFALTAPGTYQFLCYQRGHADRGQTGTITVTGSPG
jgi:plastocyanin